MNNKKSLQKHELYRNFKLMFWIRALLEVKVINVIITIFYLYRGLSLSQVFYLSIVFSLVSLISEIPSSYMADKWSRKKVIILAVFVSFIYWLINIFAWSFPIFILAIVFYAFAHALLSGTDEALIYDTSQQLGIEINSLKHLGNYFSARRVFKIITPVLAVIIAHNLTNFQYILILSIDVLATFIAFILSFFLIEPNHVMLVEQIEAGVFKDALKLFRQNTNLFRIMFNKSLFFIAIFILWRISSEYFVSKGVSLLSLGITASIYQTFIYEINQHITKFLPNISIELRINFINSLIVILLSVFLIFHIIGSFTIFSLFIYAVVLILEMIRWPLFSEIINKTSSSYNRATVISLANFLKNILDIPIMFLSAYLIKLGYSYFFGLVLTLTFVATILLPLKNAKG